MKYYIKLVLMMNIPSSIYYSLRFKMLFFVARGSRVVVKKGASVIRGENLLSSVYIGFNETRSSGALLYIDKRGTLYLGKSVTLRADCKVIVMEGAVVKIGDRTFINDGARIQAAQLVTIGNDCAVGWGSILTDSDMHGLNGGAVSTEPVFLGDKVWLAMRVSILKGSKLNDLVVVGAGSMIHRQELTSGWLYAGSPVEKRKEINDWG